MFTLISYFGPGYNGQANLRNNSKQNLTKPFINWATSCENLFMPYANNKGADQPVHPRNLISVFVVLYLDSISPLVSTYKLQASSYLLRLRRPVCVLLARKPRRQIFSCRGSIMPQSWHKRMKYDETNLCFETIAVTSFFKSSGVYWHQWPVVWFCTLVLFYLVLNGVLLIVSHIYM